jgi:hypothetical protein
MARAPTGAAILLLAASACSLGELVPEMPQQGVGSARLALVSRPGDFELRGYQELKGDDGVRVFRGDGDIIRVGGEATLPVAPRVLLAALLDYPRHAGVMHHVVESRILQRGENKLLVYQRLSLPLVDDRDFTLRVDWTEERGSYFVSYRAVDDGPAELDGVVRVTRHDGGWQLHPTDDGGTRVRCESNLDLAGSLPAWMSRSGAADELPGVFEGLCRLVEPHLRGQPCPTRE